jgi:hypothetical protein
MAISSQLDRDGNQWAHLCEKHHKLLDGAVSKPDAKLLMAYWIKASGGAKKMAKTFGNCLLNKARLL